MDSRSKTAIFQIIAIQLAITIAVVIAVFSISDAPAAAAAASGGIICIVTTAFFSLRVFAGGPAWSAGRFLQRFYRAEIQKIALTIVLLLTALLWLKLPGLPLVLTFTANTMAFWFVLLFKT